MLPFDTLFGFSERNLVLETEMPALLSKRIPICLFKVKPTEQNGIDYLTTIGFWISHYKSCVCVPNGFSCHGRRSKKTKVQRGQRTFSFISKMSPTKQKK